MTSELAQKAIAAAMAGDWEEAEKVNLEILKADPKNLEALNRLGRAYLGQGEKAKAQNPFKRVLKMDSSNSIAQRNLELLKNTKIKKEAKVVPSPDFFIEEPGKTKTITLTKLADKKTLFSVSVGEEIIFKAHKRLVTCHSQEGVYIGRLPDDLSVRLAKLIKGGNKYQTFLKSLNYPEVKVFIREVKRAKRFADLPSFPKKGELSYQAFIPPELVHEERPEMEALEEE